MLKCHLKDLGLIPYQEAYTIQKREVEEVLKGGPQTLFLCEHPAVLTMGRMAQKKHILLSEDRITEQGIQIHWIDRGGDITLHSPGQLVVYPILNLKLRGKDLHEYLRKLEEVAIDLLKRFGIVANRFPGVSSETPLPGVSSETPRSGVWVGQKKIVSLGIGVRQWVTFHGLAINVNTDLDLFRLIKPCGLDVEMTSMAAIKGKNLKMEDVKDKIKDSFQEIFGLEI